MCVYLMWIYFGYICVCCMWYYLFCIVVVLVLGSLLSVVINSCVLDVYWCCNIWKCFIVGWFGLFEILFNE